MASKATNSIDSGGKQLVVQALTADGMQQRFKTLLPPSIKPDKFTEVTIAAITNNPEVLEADRDSLYSACLASAKRGLLPDKKQGALVVYSTNLGTRQQPRYVKLVQFMPMVEGIIHEMGKAGIKAYAVSVYGNDEIDLWNDDTGQHVRHKPNPFSKDRGELVGVFAAAITPDGRPYVEPLNLDDIHRVAARSRQCRKNDQGELQLGGTWRSDFERMAQKSALHRLRKRLPIADEDALQNLKDMEEETDVVFDNEPGTQAPAAAESGASVSQSPPSPPKQRNPRRSRVLDTLADEEPKPEPEPEDHNGSMLDQGPEFSDGDVV